MKIFFGKFGHEANTFSSHFTSTEEFLKGSAEGEAIFDKFRGKTDYISGMIQCAEENGVTLIPSFSSLKAAPTLSAECVNTVMEKMLDSLNNCKSEIDGICIALHGAGCCEFTDDLEAYILEKIREVVGNDMPITASFDLHGNISSKMVALTNGVFSVKHYPHIDMHHAGYDAMKLLISIIKSGKKPQVAIKKLPMVIPLSNGYTLDFPFTKILEYFEEYKKKNNLIDISLFHGFIYADTPYTTASITVVSNSDAQKHADYLAEYIWNMREHFIPKCLTPAQALDLAVASKKEGYIVINEFSDNPGGGAPGDGTHLLREFLKRNLPGTIFGYIYDPAAVEFLFNYKPGDTVSFYLGGRTEKIHGEPLYIENARICCISDGDFTHTSPMFKGKRSSSKACVRVNVGNVDIIICSYLKQTYDDRPFIVTGADINQYRYVGLKSAHHFRAFFADRAAEIIPCDPPGLQSSNMRLYDFRNIPRPIFPLDDDVSFSI